MENYLRIGCMLHATGKHRRGDKLSMNLRGDQFLGSAFVEPLDVQNALTVALGDVPRKHHGVVCACVDDVISVDFRGPLKACGTWKKTADDWLVGF